MTDTTVAKDSTDPTDPRPPCEKCGSKDHTTGYHENSTETSPTGYHEN